MQDDNLIHDADVKTSKTAMTTTSSLVRYLPCFYLTNNIYYLNNKLTYLLYLQLAKLLELFYAKPVPKSKLLRIVVSELLQAGCPSCHPTNSIKALKDEIINNNNKKQELK